MIAADGNRLGHIANGQIRTDASAALADRLVTLHEALRDVILAHRPDGAAVEEVFLNTNAQSTLKLGHARAAALIAPARAGLPVAEYSTRLVKKAVVGTGAADKAQIGFMIARLLPTAGKTTADCADALAVAITHANLRAAHRRVA